MPKAKQQEPKLKTSCDNCSSAKVRCEKNADATADSPTCQRCTQQNLECVYGVSQRKGKPFQPYPKSKPADIAQNGGNGEGRQNLDSNSRNSDNVAQNEDKGEGQNLDNNSNTTNKDNAYPWPKTGWNLSDIGPDIDFSSTPQNPTDDIELTLPRKHDMCSIMSNLRAHLLKLDKLLDSTYGSHIPKSAADQYLTEFRTIRATIQRLLNCNCHTCYDPQIIFLLASLSSQLSESYKSIVMNLVMALGAAIDDKINLSHLVPLASSLQLEVAQFREICHLIREKASESPEAKAVGDAFYEMLCGQEKRFSRLLHKFISNLACYLNRLQNPLPVSY